MGVTNSQIKKQARAAGHDIQHVRAGRGSQLGSICVFFGVELPSAVDMAIASRWLRMTYPDVVFTGDIKPEEFCSFWLDRAIA